jgi:hypothetical protein
MSQENYLKSLLIHDLNVFLKNIESGKYRSPILEHEWKIHGLNIGIISDVDGVWTRYPHLYGNWYRYILGKSKYAPHEKKILEHEKQIDLSGDGSHFAGIAKELYDAGLTYSDYIEACEYTGKETPSIPYAHEAISSIKKITPSMDIGFNSASFIPSLKFFSQYKYLPISYIDGSWLEFKNGKFNGKWFFNFGPNKFNTGIKRLRNLNCYPDLRMNLVRENITLSDSRTSDRYFRKFVGLGGMSVWLDERIQERMNCHPKEKPEIVEINIPEALKDMRIFSSLLKWFYRIRIITLKTNQRQLGDASKSVRELISLGEECLNLTDEKIFNMKLKEFQNSSPAALNSLSTFDFPRYSTGIDFKYLELLGESEMEKKKEILSSIIELYKTNFPEALAEIV